MTKRPLQNKVSQVKAMGNIRPSASSDGHSGWVSFTPFKVYFFSTFTFQSTGAQSKDFQGCVIFFLAWALALAIKRPLTEAVSSIIHSLTIAIVFELIYYTNGHPRA
jgi:hypothetical protein